MWKARREHIGTRLCNNRQKTHRGLRDFFNPTAAAGTRVSDLSNHHLQQLSDHSSGKHYEREHESIRKEVELIGSKLTKELHFEDNPDQATKDAKWIIDTTRKSKGPLKLNS